MSVRGLVRLVLVSTLLLVLLGVGRPVPAAAQTPCSASSPAIVDIPASTFEANADLAGLINDCTTLLGLKNALIGTESGAGSLDWAEDSRMNQWEGVTVEKIRVTEPNEETQPGVTKLDLRDKNLTGEIPPELGTLPGLAQLYLSNNQLSGEIPATWGIASHPLTKLTALFLDDNQLTGEIPPELGKLILSALFLRNNQLSGDIPPELGNIGNDVLQGSLGSLYLSNNRLSGEIPPELGTLRALSTLDLSKNQLSGEIPPELGVIPAGVFNTPEDFGPLTKRHFQALYLNDNRLTGEIPPELGTLTNLQDLYLSNNQLTGEIPATWGDPDPDSDPNTPAPHPLTELRDVRLDNNQLSGPIPPGLGNSSNLIYLILNTNQLSGPIPETWGHPDPDSDPNTSPPHPLTNPQYLYLSNNQLTGDIPAALGNLSKLIYLILNTNPITGPIPATWGDPDYDPDSDPNTPAPHLLTNLSLLYLYDTDWTGTIPAGVSSQVTYLQTNRRPTAPAVQPKDITPGQTFSLSLAFTDRDEDTLKYHATQADGSVLPASLPTNPGAGDAGVRSDH